MVSVDARLAFAAKVEQKFGPQVAKLLGLTYSGQADVRLGDVGTAAATGAYNGAITISRGELLGSKADLRGAVIHEVTHVEGAAYGRAGYTPHGEETFADYARYMLNPKEGPGWSASAPVLGLAAETKGKIQQQAAAGLQQAGLGGAVVNGSQNNGGKPGRSGRQRGALTNGKGPAVPPPAVDPSSAQAYAGQEASATSTLYDTLAGLKPQLGAIRGQFGIDKAAVRAAQISGQVGAEDNALQRGIVGSSIDLAGRSAVDATAAQGMQAAIQAKIQGVLGIKQQKLTAIDNYWTQFYQIQAEKAANQEAAAAAAVKDNTVGNTVGAGGGGGGSPAYHSTNPVANEIQRSGAYGTPRAGYTGGVVRGPDGAPVQQATPPTAPNPLIDPAGYQQWLRSQLAGAGR